MIKKCGAGEYSINAMKQTIRDDPLLIMVDGGGLGVLRSERDPDGGEREGGRQRDTWIQEEKPVAEVVPGSNWG